jgi:hypothetical protein
LNDKRVRLGNPQSEIHNPKSSLIRPPVNRLGNHFRIGDGRRVQCCAAPRHIQRHPREIDDAAVPAITAQIVRRSHEDAVNRTWLDAQRTKHALRVVNRVSGDLETLAAFDPLFANINAVDRARFSALIARDARRQIKPVKTAIPGSDRYGQLWIFKVLGKRLPFWTVSLNPRAKRYPQAMRNGVDGVNDVAHPGPHSLHFVYHWAERVFYIDSATANVRCAFSSHSGKLPQRYFSKVTCGRTRIIEKAMNDPQPAKILRAREQ